MIPKDGNYFYWENRFLDKTPKSLAFHIYQGDRAQSVLWGIHAVRKVHGEYGGGGVDWG